MSSSKKSIHVPEPLILHLDQGLVREFGPLTGKCFLVAYSGGADSTALLHLASTLGSLKGFSLLALWVDHGIRPEAERNQEEQLVRLNCSKWGVSLQVCRIPPGESPGPQGVEAWARSWRLNFLETWARNKGCHGILTAHHLDDQAHTVLMRLLKGRSFGGLGGIPQRRGPYFRPLLNIPQEKLRDYLTRESLDFHQDSTNLGEDYERNRLRQELGPVLDRLYPHWTRSLGEFARDQGERISSVNKKLEPHRGASGPGLAWDLWRSWTLEEKIHWMGLELLPQGLQIPRGRFLSAVKDLEHRGASENFGTQRFVVEKSRVRLLQVVVNFRDIGYFKTMEWDIPLVVQGWSLTVSKLSGDLILPLSEDEGTPFLVSRSWLGEPGFPQGGDGLKKLFQAWGLPSVQRDMVPVITGRKKILAVLCPVPGKNHWILEPKEKDRTVYLTIRKVIDPWAI